MSYESRAYDKHAGDGFPPEPVVVLVVSGTHDVSRLVSLLNGGQPLVEQLQLGRRIVRQVKRHNSGRAALKLLRDHGGPDFTDDTSEDMLAENAKLREQNDTMARALQSSAYAARDELQVRVERATFMDEVEQRGELPPGRYRLLAEVEVTEDKQLVPGHIHGGKRVRGFLHMGDVVFEPIGGDH